MRLKGLAGAAVAVLLGASASAHPHDHALDRLHWLSGEWVTESNGRWTEEQWSEPRGGLMLGLGRSGKAERAVGFEFMRIAIDANGTVVFWGSPGGSGAVPFRLAEEAAASATFVNPRHDFPKRISYRRDGDTLVATVTGDDPTNSQTWTYRRREAAVGTSLRDKNASR